MNDVSQIFVLLLAFEVKQLLCDYPILPDFLLKRFHSNGIKAFILYSAFHGFITFTICLLLTNAEYPLALLMSLLDFAAGFALAMFRSHSSMIARFKPLDLDEFMSASRKAKRQHRMYWTFFGLDQAIHHMTHFSIIYILCLQGVVWMM
jgi:hypothetical protein